MRRLLFNPLVQQPYARGEYEPSTHRFVLDKEIKANHLYYLFIESSSADSSTCALLDTRSTRSMLNTSVFAFIGVSGYERPFHAKASIDSKYITIVLNDSDNPTTDEDYTIYVYQLM